MPKLSMQIGSDTVELDDASLTIQASRKIPDWVVSRHRPLMVIFQEKSYRLDGMSPKADGSVDYSLSAWAEALHQIPSMTVEYSEEFVEIRDTVAKETQKRDAASSVLVWLYPFLGFLFSRTKLKLQERLGLHPVTMTEQSVFLEAMATVSCGALSVISLLAPPVSGAFHANVTFDAFMENTPFITLFLAADLAIRYHSLLKGGMEQLGFYEWLVRIRLRSDLRRS